MSENKHKCPLCGSKYICTTSFGHDSEEVENYVCEGDYLSPCDNHSMDEIGKWAVREGLIEDLPLTPENYGKANYKVLVTQGLNHGSTWL